MSLETGTYISDLVVTNPTASDPKSAGDDHLRLLKSTLKTTFPNVTGAVTPTHTQLNYVTGVTSAIQTQIDSKGSIAGQTWTGTHAFPSTTSIGNVSSVEIAYLDGTTSNVQVQLDTLTSQKAALSGGTYSGTHNFSGATLTVATPTATTDAVTKAYADGLSFATTLPDQTGNSGKFVTTNGTTASWGYANIGTVVTATTATTLSTTPTVLQITPASYGVSVTLPDATTCPLGGPLHKIDNKGAYPVRILNNSGTLIGFVFAGVTSDVSLEDKSTAAGVWNVSNVELVGASAQLLTANMAFIDACIDIGSSQEIIIGRGVSSANVYGVVYNRSTNTFGSVTLIRTGTFGTNLVAACLSAANQVLVTSVASGAATFEAVTLSISGTTITVNTAATATLSANISAFADGCGLIAVGSSFVTSYRTATPTAEIRALSISGTTVTIGAATTLPGSQTGSGLISSSGSIVIAASVLDSTGVYATPYTVSGSTLTVGTQGSVVPSVGATIMKFFQLGSRWVCLYSNQSATDVRAMLCSLSSTTITVTSATLFGSTTTLQDAIVVGSNKVLVLNNQTTNNANILTDTAGTASAGTAITLDAQTTKWSLYTSGTDVAVQSGSTTYFAHIVDCSGASPVLAKSISTGFVSTTYTAAFDASNAVLQRGTRGVFGTAFAQTITTVANAPSGHFRVRSGVATLQKLDQVPQTFVTRYRGKSDSERWATDSATVITKVECVA